MESCKYGIKALLYTRRLINVVGKDLETPPFLATNKITDTKIFNGCQNHQVEVSKE